MSGSRIGSAGDQGEPALARSLTPPGDSETLRQPFDKTSASVRLSAHAEGSVEPLRVIAQGEAYVNPNDPTDHTLSVGDWVRGRPGVANSKAIRDALDTLKGREIIVPVWGVASGQGSNLQYRLAGFARVQITSYRLPGQNRLSAIYLGPAVCGGAGPAPVKIRYTYDKLYRLTGAEYSTGESSAYAYDRVSNRVAMTETTPLSGTVVAAYTYDAANYLTRLAFSDGRVYTYTWSPRGQMLAEWTQGYPVRAFSYDAAGRMIEARVLTLTTHFVYNGLGARIAVSIEGHGTTTYTLDYAAGNRILAEQTITGTTLYLYGRDCLGELRDAEWMYYLHDGAGYVRQGTDEQGQVVSVWRYDPNGTVLEGPQGPVSHLVCEGVYDWSTGLIYKGERYFDPTLGIWLALTPLVVIQAWRGRKKKQRGVSWYVVLLLVVCVSGLLVACAKPPPPPRPCPLQPTCRVDHVDRLPEEVVKDPDRGFYMEKHMAFWLEPGTVAEEACFCGSWIQGTYAKSGIPVVWHPTPTSDFPTLGIGVFYIGHAITFADTPGFIEPFPEIDRILHSQYSINAQFWTVLYDKCDVEGLSESDFRGPPNWDPVPVFIEEWRFVDNYRVGL